MATALVPAPIAKMLATPGGKTLIDGVWESNPIFRQILGICSALAVTSSVQQTMVMCIALIFVTSMSEVLVSALRDYTPSRVRMIVQIMIVATFVIVVDMFLKAFWVDMSEAIGPYVGLIITNCIIMGRCEAFAKSNPVLPSFLDGIGCGIGYTIILMGVAVIREFFGKGMILGIWNIQDVTGVPWEPWVLMILPSGAFFALGIIVWAARAAAGMTED